MSTAILSDGDTPLIAVVDDDRAFLQLMEDLLTDVGYHVRLRPVTERVVTACVRECPDLLVLDLVATTRDAGLQLLHALREEVALADLPVIVCSADMLLLRERAGELTALRCAVMEKPFKPDVMLERIAAMLATAAARREVPPGVQEPPTLEELIGETHHLLPRIDTVSAAELRTLARKLRMLANYADAWAARAGQAESC